MPPTVFTINLLKFFSVEKCFVSGENIFIILNNEGTGDTSFQPWR